MRGFRDGGSIGVGYAGTLTLEKDAEFASSEYHEPKLCSIKMASFVRTSLRPAIGKDLMVWLKVPYSGLDTSLDNRLAPCLSESTTQADMTHPS